MTSAPRFSVIVPAFGVEACLPAALDSVLEQDYRDVEVLPVDDASPDSSGRIMDDYALRDHRVRPIHLEDNGGLSNARNIGISEAAGDYLIFLDGDDLLAKRALAQIADRITELCDPDLLMYRYGHVRPCGLNKAKRYPRELAGADTADVRAHPELIESLPLVAWNKAYRRELIDHWDLTFPPGCYEDQPWSFFTILAAGRVGLLDSVCLEYRRCRPGSIISTPGPQHMDVLDQFERMFAFVATHPDVDRRGVRQALHRRMVKYLHFLGHIKSSRIPPDRLAEFRRRSAELGERFRPAPTTPTD